MGQMSPSMLGSSYAPEVFLSRMRSRGFTRTDTCGMKREVTGARILLSLFPSFPDTGTGSHYQDFTLVGFLVQCPFQQA
jgi:hypothetical protein